VRHGLKHDQFAWAREKFLRYNNIDDFLKASLDEAIQEFTNYRDTRKLFYGQPITFEVLEFLLKNQDILAPKRYDFNLYISACPYDMVHYLQETDTRKKRYYACHCPFARESILSENGEVSKTICLCSLGHAKIMWDTIFGRELDGEVVQSAWGGDLACKYVNLSEDIIRQYT
jgi:hypothetical protein